MSVYYCMYVYPQFIQWMSGGLKLKPQLLTQIPWINHSLLNLPGALSFPESFANGWIFVPMIQPSVYERLFFPHHKGFQLYWNQRSALFKPKRILPRILHKERLRRRWHFDWNKPNWTKVFFTGGLPSKAWVTGERWFSPLVSTKIQGWFDRMWADFEGVLEVRIVNK